MPKVREREDFVGCVQTILNVDSRSLIINGRLVQSCVFCAILCMTYLSLGLKFE